MNALSPRITFCKVHWTMCKSPFLSEASFDWRKKNCEKECGMWLILGWWCSFFCELTIIAHFWWNVWMAVSVLNGLTAGYTTTTLSSWSHHISAKTKRKQQPNAEWGKCLRTTAYYFLRGHHKVFKLLQIFFIHAHTLQSPLTLLRCGSLAFTGAAKWMTSNGAGERGHYSDVEV